MILKKNREKNVSQLNIHYKEYFKMFYSKTLKQSLLYEFKHILYHKKPSIKSYFNILFQRFYKRTFTTSQHFKFLPVLILMLLINLLPAKLIR